MHRLLLLTLALGGMVSAFPDSPTPKAPSPEPHWAFQMPSASELKGQRHPIDQLLTHGDLLLVPDAPREVLLRRAFHVTTGLLPSPEEAERYLNDKRQGAEWMTGVTEAALSQKTYGERWARHWLDVARYADSKSAAITENADYPYAYTYRDWVIGAFNRDLPFDQFAHLQVAADLMETPKSDLAALGFLTVGRVYQGGQQNLVIADRIDVTTRGFMGLTVACARCHDHKSDPIPTADFYSLYGVFNSSTVPKQLPIISTPEDSPGYRDFIKKRDGLARAVHEHTKKIDPEYQIPEDLLNFEIGEANKKFNQKDREKFRRLIGEVTKLEASSPHAPPRAMALQKRNPRNPVIHVRGDPRNRGEKVPRRFLSLFNEKDEVFKHGSGRLELAYRLTDERNPLTARVWVNRVWMHLMGAPLVSSPGDFGLESTKPLQLPLLDHLALTLVEKRWSTKALITHIMTSEAWRRSSQASASHFESDPENQFYARANRQRKDLEAWRDSALQVSSRLSTEIGGQPIELDKAPFAPRRTIYGRVQRGYFPSILRAFDFPGSEEPTMRRSQTTTPMQALYLMNSFFLHGEARALNKKSRGIAELYQSVFQRAPSPEEKQAAQTWLKNAQPARSSGAWDYGYLYNDSLEFKPLPMFKNKQWQGGHKMPDSKLGHLNWNPGGGHPEYDKAVVASWTAPADLTINLRGELHVPSKQGNGVHAKLMRPDGSVLGEWTALPTEKTPTHFKAVTVKKGEQLWFVVDSRGNQDFDSFHWQPRLSDDRGEVTQAQKDFCGPGLAPRVQLAQTLLLSNEFFYID